MSPIFANPRQLQLEIPAATQIAAWQLSQRLQVPGARWQVYLNQLCLRVCLNWFRSEFHVPLTTFPGVNANPIQWELVTGSRIRLGDVQLVLIPTDMAGQDELLIPQEWVDIPDWVGDYYLAVTVSPEDTWLEIWGYTTYQQLQIAAQYDDWERSYRLDTVDLSCDIGALWSILEHGLAMQAKESKQAEVSVLAEMSATQAEKLIEQLACPETVFPRSAMLFAQWGALLANAKWLKQLCDRRLAALEGRVTLSQHLQGIQGAIAAGWQAIEDVFGTEATQMAFAFRQDAPAEGRQAKVIYLDSGESLAVRLALLWQRESDNRITIRAQLYPAERDACLPAQITLKLLSEQNDFMQSIQAGETDNFIQLRRFKCLPGSEFCFEIRLGDRTYLEWFSA
ncbi:MAG: DUF1822 family protein [Cyanobacteria bacterium P01_F01_bin.56]